MLIKGDSFTGTATDYTSEGLAVVKHEGQVIFVHQLLIGEEAKIDVIFQKKKITFGVVKKLIKPSANRQEKELCKSFGDCGGCNLLHMKYKHQVEAKTNIVKNNFRKYAQLDVEIDEFVSSEQTHYRNKASYPIQYVNNQYRTGFYKIRTNNIIEHDTCINQVEEINVAIKDIINKLNENKFNFELRHIVIRKTDSGLNVLFVTRKQNKAFVKFILDNIKGYNSVAVNINVNPGNKIIDGELYTVYKKDENIITINDLKFNVSYDSFFQVNVFNTSKLYDLVNKEINQDDNVLELYCGTGTISLLASKKARNVTAVEIVRSAVNDANMNKELNGIYNVKFVCNDAKVFLEKNKKQFDTLIIDPPRKGLEGFAFEHIAKADANKIIYVSCSSDTLARDVKLLSEKYKMTKLSLVDMFPNTKHIESVAILEKK